MPGRLANSIRPRAVTDFMARMIRPKIGERMADFACGTGGFLTSWLKELHKQVRTTEDEAAFSNSVYGIEKKQFPLYALHHQPAAAQPGQPPGLPRQYPAARRAGLHPGGLLRRGSDEPRPTAAVKRPTSKTTFPPTWPAARPPTCLCQ